MSIFAVLNQTPNPEPLNPTSIMLGLRMNEVLPDREVLQSKSWARKDQVLQARTSVFWCTREKQVLSPALLKPRAISYLSRPEIRRLCANPNSGPSVCHEDILDLLA